MHHYSYYGARAFAACLIALFSWATAINSPVLAQRGALLLDTEGYASAEDDDALDLANESMTVEAWIKHDGESASDAVVVTKSQSGSIDYEISLVGSGEEVPVRFYFYSNSYFAESAVGIPAKKWTHVAGTWDGTTLSVYVNGELQGTRQSSGSSLLTSSPLVVGANTNGSDRYFSGQIDEVRIWDVVRSSAAIRGSMYGELESTESGLRAYYSFDADGSDAVGDNDLDLIGSAEVATPGVFPVPPDLFAAAGNASVTLQWNERLGEDDANAADEFNVYRSTAADFSDRQLVTTVSDLTYTDEAATNGTTYYYQVTSVDAESAESDYSYAVVTTPYDTAGGGSLSIEGAGYATAGHRPSLTLGNETLTVEAWIKHDGTSDADAIILTKRDGSNIDYELSFSGSGEEALVRFYIYSTSYYAESFTGIAADQWTHVAGRYDGSEISIYVNGELHGTRGTSGATLATDTPLTFGANTNGNGRFYGGLIDEVRIWDEARASFQIRQDYRSRLTGGEDGLRAYFAFDSPGSTAPQGYVGGGTGTLNLQGDAEIVARGAYPLPPHTYAEPLKNGILVSWAGRTAEEAGEYRIYRSTQPNGGDRQLLATLPGTVTVHTDANLSLGTTYFYQAAAVNDAGQESDFAGYAVATAAASRDGNALQVGGAGGFATVTHRPSVELANESMTVEAWIKHDGQSDADAVILTKRSGNTIDYELSLVGSGDEVPVRFYIYSPSYYAESDVMIAADTWTHVAGTYDGSEIAIYVNGDLAGTRNTSGASLSADAPLTIGANTNGNGRFFSGLIDEVRIWDVERSVINIRQSYLDVLTGSEEGLRAYFRFDETGGEVAYGSSTNAMTADLEGSATFTASQSPVDVEDEAVLPESFVLDGNYPNPFNPRTIIRFGLDKPGIVRLAVYDVAGRQVALVLEGDTRTAGWHEVAFDASDLPSGIYLYRVEVGDRVQIGRMTLVK